MIQQHIIIEGNLAAMKCIDDFGGPNMWNLCVKDVSHGGWEDVQWMDVNRIQQFFKTKLQRYKQVGETKKQYELV